MAQPVKTHNVLKEGWIKKSTTKLLKKWAEVYARIEDRRYLCIYTDDHSRQHKLKIDMGKSTINYNVNKPKQFHVYDADGQEHQFECGTIIDSTNWLINLKQINGIRPQPILAAHINSDSDRRSSFSTQSDLDLIPTRTPSVSSSTSHVFGDFGEQKMAVSQMDIDDQYMKAIFLYQNQEYEQCEQITRGVLRMDKHHPQALQLFRYLIDRERSQREESTSRSLFGSKKKKTKRKKKSNEDHTKDIHRTHLRSDNSAEYSRSDADTSYYTLNSSDEDGTSRSITSVRSKSFAPVIIGRIDGALSLYYSRFPNANYKTRDGKNKFKAYCEDEFANDDDEIEEEIQGGLEDCILVQFDEDADGMNGFPFEYLIDPQKRSMEIFRVIKHCYLYKKPPPPLFEFETDDFFHVLDIFSTPIKMKPNNSFVRKTMNGLRLNKRSSKSTSEDGGDSSTVLYLTGALHQLIGISQNKKNELFNKDFASLLIQSYGRYCIAQEIETVKKQEKHKKQRGNERTFYDDMTIDIEDEDIMDSLHTYIDDEEYDTDGIIEDISCNEDAYKLSGFGDYPYSNLLSLTGDMDLAKGLKQHVYDEMTICDAQRVFGQIYYKQTIWQQDGNSKQVKQAKVVSNLRSNLEKEYASTYEGKVVAILAIDGEIVSESHRSYVHADSIHDDDIIELRRLTQNDYDNVVFRFMSSNRFYWSLVPRVRNTENGVSFFQSAFNEFSDKICAPLTLDSVHLIRDNIFIFWVYIWSMSSVIKTYMQSGGIAIPLQVDFVIIPACNEDEYIDDISERFNIYDHKFESELCDPRNIGQIENKLQGLLTKCTVKMKSRECRVVMIVDRRWRRREYFANKHCDRIFAYKPPTKYSQCDKRHEILNCIWNTSSFVIPPPPHYLHNEEQKTQHHANETQFGARHNNLFVLSYLIRKKSQFVHLFDGNALHKQQEDLELEKEFSQNQSDDGDKSYFCSLQSISDTSSAPPQNLTTLGARELANKLKNKNLSNVQLKQLWQEATDAMNFNATIREITEYQAVQSFIMRQAMERKRDNVTATFLFYNGGYCRFEPCDLIRIVPHLFDLSCIRNYDHMIRDFQTFHDKLWQIDDEIWMKYKDEYLRSYSAMDQRMRIETVGTDPNDRERIAQYCVWDKDEIFLDVSNSHATLLNVGRDNVEVVTNDKHLKVLAVADTQLNEFMEWHASSQGHGMIIDRIKDAWYARYSGIQAQIDEDQYLWSVTQINNVNVTKMDPEQIKSTFGVKKDAELNYRLRLIGGLFRICDSRHNERVIATTIKLRTFLKWDKSKKQKKNKTTNANGLLIKEILSNDYGDAFRETGVQHGWSICAINSVDIRNQTNNEIKHYLQSKIYSKRNAQYRITCKYFDKRHTNLMPSKAKFKSNKRKVYK
eukprot:110315_1